MNDQMLTTHKTREVKSSINFPVLHESQSYIVSSSGNNHTAAATTASFMLGYVHEDVLSYLVLDWPSAAVAQSGRSL